MYANPNNKKISIYGTFIPVRKNTTIYGSAKPTGTKPSNTKISIYGKSFHIWKNERGYIALVSVLIISVVLLTLAVSVSLTGFYARSNILGTEVKEQSTALAESCIQKAIADVAIGNPALGKVKFGENPYDNDYPYECTIVSVLTDELVTGQTTIYAQATSTPRNSVTNLVVTIDSNNQDVVKWREVPMLP